MRNGTVGTECRASRWIDTFQVERNDTTTRRHHPVQWTEVAVPQHLTWSLRAACGLPCLPGADPVIT